VRPAANVVVSLRFVPTFCAQRLHEDWASLTVAPTPPKQLRFGAFMNLPSIHPTGLAHPDAVP